MDLPVVSTGYCEGLHSRLEELLGPDTISVHQELGLGMDLPAEEPVTMSLEPPHTAVAVLSEVEPVVEAQGPVAVAAETSVAEVVGDNPPF